MGNTIKVIGTGPGDRSYITEIALKHIEEAEVVIGGKRLLAEFACFNQEQYPLEGNLKEALEFIKNQSKSRKIAVLVSGDTGIFSFASYLQTNLNSKELEFISGISSFQILFARLKRSWDKAVFVSLHDKPPGYLHLIVKEERTTVIFTDNKWTPPKVARYLLKKGLSDMTVAVGSDLSYPWERVEVTNFSLLSESKEDWSNSVMVIMNE